MAKKGLGRGLESLIPSRATISKGIKSREEGNVVEVLIGKIIPNPHQPREAIAEASLRELALSIKEHGVIQPLIISEVGGDQYELLAGERRLKAAKIAGLRKIPAIIRSASEQQKLEVALVENIQRQDLNPLEEAKAYKRLINEFNLNQDQVAQKVGKSRASVANILRILTLPSVIKKAISSGKLTLGHAKLILSVRGEEEQIRLFKSILGNQLSVRDTEKSVKKTKVRGRVGKQRSPEIMNLEENLRQTLGTKVEIRKKDRGGDIIIGFYSNGELRELVKKIIRGEVG
jgi:ParB family chromosome partitioning protein